MNNEYLISVIIPTKNRTVYALNAIKNIIILYDNDVQIVVQDNSDDNELQRLINKQFIEYTCIKYKHHKETLSFVDNFNMAIDNADGEYLLIIGDDDGVTHHLLNVVKWAKNKNIQAIKPSLSLIYYWPNSGVFPKKEDIGILNISNETGKIHYSNPSTSVKLLLENGGINYLSLDVVKIYHGIVRRDILVKIKKESGDYIHGLSPDIYSAVILSLKIDSLAVIDIPLTISGICNNSGSSDSATGRHTGDFKDIPHLVGQQEYKWSNLVPKFYCVETIWADSLLAAIQWSGRHSLFKVFNGEILCIVCLIRYPNYKKEIFLHYTSYFINNISQFPQRLYHLAKYLTKKIFKKMFTKWSLQNSTKIVLFNVKNISDACQLYRTHSNHTYNYTPDIIVKQKCDNNKK
jgi:glycosyltransferase involved in cell wall biosynthesis